MSRADLKGASCISIMNLVHEYHETYVNKESYYYYKGSLESFFELRFLLQASYRKFILYLEATNASNVSFALVQTVNSDVNA